MSSPDYAITPTLFAAAPPATFIAATGTAAKIVVDQTAPAVAGAVPTYGGSAANPLLGSSNTPQLYGGCTVIDLVASSTDAAKDVQLYVGTVATTQSAGATGNLTTTTSTIVRASGSFITDGWAPGDLVMTFSPFGAAANAAVDGILGVVTGVAALTLTVNGTPFAALTLAAGTRVVRVRPHFKQTVAATAGTANNVPSQGLLGQINDGSAVRTELKLGANNVLIAALAAAASALPAYVSVGAVVALY